MNEPTLLMIHGLVGSLHYFDPQARMSGAVAVTEDLLGYGRRSNVSPERLTLIAQADHVARRIDELPCEKLWLLGHSMGGAVAVLAANRRPKRTRGIINVEGNFAEKDTFWSRRIAARRPDEWAEDYRAMQDDSAGWLERCGVRPDPQRVAWADHILENQPAGTVYTMAKALLRETLCPEYLDVVRRVVERGVPMHLVAGEKSAADWGVPDFVHHAAASYTEQPDVGHLMMLEAPGEFCRILASILAGRVRHR